MILAAARALDCYAQYGRSDLAKRQLFAITVQSNKPYSSEHMEQVVVSAA
jgi:hypothetical protein